MVKYQKLFFLPSSVQNEYRKKVILGVLDILTLRWACYSMPSVMQFVFELPFVVKYLLHCFCISQELRCAYLVSVCNQKFMTAWCLKEPDVMDKRSGNFVGQNPEGHLVFTFTSW